MKVSEIYTPNPQCVSPEVTLTQAAEKMKALDVGMLPVCESDRLIGTITDRDIVIRAVAVGSNPESTFVHEAMTHKMVYCFDDEDIAEAALLMEKQQVRRLPVINRNKRLVGIVSLGDLAVRTHRERLVGAVLEGVSEPMTDAELLETRS
jgi:CBS domain-containing protein